MELHEKPPWIKTMEKIFNYRSVWKYLLDCHVAINIASNPRVWNQQHDLIITYVLMICIFVDFLVISYVLPKGMISVIITIWSDFLFTIIMYICWLQPESSHNQKLEANLVKFRDGFL